MKRILVSAISTLAIASPALAQDVASAPAVAPITVTNTYVEIGTTFEDETVVALGTGIGAGPVSAYAELSGSTTGDFKARAFTDAEFSKFRISPGLNYHWGKSGGDLVGFGEGNVWGDVTADMEVSINPGIVGGEYAFANSAVGFDGWSLDWAGGEVGAGYQLDVAENVYLDARVSWGYDDQFQLGSRRVLASVGLKF